MEWGQVKEEDKKGEQRRVDLEDGKGEKWNESEAGKVSLSLKKNNSGEIKCVK